MPTALPAMTASRSVPDQTRKPTLGHLDGSALVRDEADTQGQSLLALARATFTVSKSEAGAYFDRAIEILSRIGDENVPRWECFLHLAAVAEAPGVVRAETAYRMSRIGELTRSLVVRDKYFDWDGTVEALAGLDPASLLTLLSRWRDRRFGDEERLLSEAVEAMSKRGHLPTPPATSWPVEPGIVSALSADGRVGNGEGRLDRPQRRCV